MFGVDYPHFESIFPATRDQVTELLADPSISEAAVRKILYQNAADVYGFDLGRLEPEIERVGFDLADLRSPSLAT
jgi:Amidohydrolase